MVDKSLIFALVLQAAAIVWYFSNLDTRVITVENTVSKSSDKSDKNDSEFNSVKDRVLKLEINLSNINTNLLEIKELLKYKQK